METRKLLKACVEGEENVSDAYVYKAFNAKKLRKLEALRKHLDGWWSHTIGL